MTTGTEPPAPLLVQLLSILRAVQWFHWTAHWAVRDYSHHLLYEKLYQTLEGEIDTLGERITSESGQAPDPIRSMHDSLRVLQLHSFPSSGDPEEIRSAARALEQYLLEALRTVRATLEARQGLSLGVDDYLAATANAHETSLYLLGPELR